MGIKILSNGSFHRFSHPKNPTRKRFWSRQKLLHTFQKKNTSKGKAHSLELGFAWAAQMPRRNIPKIPLNPKSKNHQRSQRNKPRILKKHWKSPEKEAKLQQKHSQKTEAKRQAQDKIFILQSSGASTPRTSMCPARVFTFSVRQEPGFWRTFKCRLSISTS